MILVAAPFYFISFVIIGIFIVQNLFVLILIDSLSQHSNETVNDIFNEDFKIIRQTYLSFILRREKRELLTKDLIGFYSTLPEPYGILVKLIISNFFRIGFNKESSALEKHLFLKKLEIRR